MQFYWFLFSYTWSITFAFEYWIYIAHTTHTMMEGAAAECVRISSFIKLLQLPPSLPILPPALLLPPSVFTPLLIVTVERVVI